MYYSGALVEEYNIPAGSVWGQPAASRVIAVGAINASDPGSDDIADYSSHGPAAIYLPSFESRTKPDISAIDAVRAPGVTARRGDLRGGARDIRGPRVTGRTLTGIRRRGNTPQSRARMATGRAGGRSPSPG